MTQYPSFLLPNKKKEWDIGGLVGWWAGAGKADRVSSVAAAKGSRTEKLEQGAVCCLGYMLGLDFQTSINGVSTTARLCGAFSFACIF